MRIEWPNNINQITSTTVSLTEIWFLREFLLTPQTTKTIKDRSNFGMVIIEIELAEERYLIKVHTMPPYTIYSLEKNT